MGEKTSLMKTESSSKYWTKEKKRENKREQEYEEWC